MGSPKKLNLSFEKLCEIAESLNKNRENNKNKDKDEKVPTDKYIKYVYGIDRRDFSFTIKDFGITYNNSTSTYEIPKHYKNNTKIINKTQSECDKNNIKIINELAATSSNEDELEFAIESMLPDLIEMIDWYKKNKNELNTKPHDTDSIDNNLDDPMLSGAIGTHSIQCFESVYKEFLEVCNQYKGHKKQLLISLALLNFIKAYKK